MSFKTFLPVQILEPLLLMKLGVEGKGFDPQQVEQVNQPPHTVDTVAEHDRPALQIQEQIMNFFHQFYISLQMFLACLAFFFYSVRHFFDQEAKCIDTKRKPR